MKQYIGVKIIQAKPMSRQEYNDYRGWELPADENGSDEGFLVEYVDGGKSNHPDHTGYISWSPADVFKRAYSQLDKVEGLDFGEALTFLKQGHALRRAGWNGKGMYLEYIPADGWAKLFGNTTDYNNCPFISMKTADEKIVPWLASQTDMLADDWEIVKQKGGE